MPIVYRWTISDSASAACRLHANAIAPVLQVSACHISTKAVWLAILMIGSMAESVMRCCLKVNARPDGVAAASPAATGKSCSLVRVVMMQIVCLAAVQTDDIADDDANVEADADTDANWRVDARCSACCCEAAGQGPIHPAETITTHLLNENPPRHRRGCKGRPRAKILVLWRPI